MAQTQPGSTPARGRRKSHAKAGASNFTPDRRGGYSGPKPAGAFTVALTRPAFEKFGFPAAALLTDWSAIAGAALAGFTAPERLKWPHRPDNPEQANAPTAATLVLRVEGPRAIELQHRLPQLIERINSYFGFRAIAQIRLYQAPLNRTADARATPATMPLRPDRRGLVQSIRDPRLRAALSRIAASIDA